MKSLMEHERSKLAPQVCFQEIQFIMQLAQITWVIKIFARVNLLILSELSLASPIEPFLHASGLAMGMVEIGYSPDSRKISKMVFSMINDTPNFLFCELELVTFIFLYI